MEREVGGGIGMGSTCRPMAISFQCMTKSTTIKKKKEYWSGLPFPSLIQYSEGFPGGSDGKESACNVGDLGLIQYY